MSPAIGGGRLSRRMRDYLHLTIEFEFFTILMFGLVKRARLNLVFDNFIENQEAGIFKCFRVAWD